MKCGFQRSSIQQRFPIWVGMHLAPRHRTAAVSQTSRSNVRTFRAVQSLQEPPERASFLRLTLRAQSRSGLRWRACWMIHFS